MIDIKFKSKYRFICFFYFFVVENKWCTKKYTKFIPSFK
jgi:hypothetical protein